MKPLVLYASGVRHTPGNLHIRTHWREGQKPAVTLCDEPVAGMRTIALPFLDWYLALCPPCGAKMDVMLDAMEGAT